MGKDRALEAAAEAAYKVQHPNEFVTRTEGDHVYFTPWERLSPDAHARNRAIRRAEKIVAAYLDSLLGELPEEAVEAAAKAYYDDEPQVRPASDRRDKFGNWLDREPKPWEDYIKEPISDGGADERHYAREMLEAGLRSLRQGADT